MNVFEGNVWLPTQQCVGHHADVDEVRAGDTRGQVCRENFECADQSEVGCEREDAVLRLSDHRDCLANTLANIETSRILPLLLETGRVHCV